MALAGWARVPVPLCCKMIGVSAEAGGEQKAL